jgi:hypothetical protein
MFGGGGWELWGERATYDGVCCCEGEESAEEQECGCLEAHFCLINIEVALADTEYVFDDSQCMARSSMRFCIHDSARDMVWRCLLLISYF